MIPSGGGGGSAVGTATPSTSSLALPDGAASGTFTVDNTAARPGAFYVTVVSGNFTAVITGAEADGGGYVGAGLSTVVTIEPTVSGVQVGTLLVATTEGDFTIIVSSNVDLYVPLVLGALAVYDFAKMHTDGDAADGDALVTIPDKSGNGYDAPVTGALTFDEDAMGSVGQAGYAGFAGSRFFTPPASMFTALTSAGAFEIWTVSKHSSRQSGPILDWSGSASAEHQPYSSGTFYAGTGSATRIGTTSIGTWATPKALRWTNSAVDNQLVVRNVTDATNLVNSANVFVGFAAARRNVGGATLGQYYAGPISAIIVFARTLDAGERAKVETYLTNTYGS